MNNILRLFQDEPRPPFSVSLEMNNFIRRAPDTQIIFNGLKDILIAGFIIITGGNHNKIQLSSLDVSKIDKPLLEKMKKYFLSLGIRLVTLKIDKKEKDSLTRHLLYELQEIDKLDFLVTTDWRTQLIERVEFKSDREHKARIMQEINKIAPKHHVANFFLKLYKPTKLKEYAIVIKKAEEKEDVADIFYFDFAQISNHQNLRYCLPDNIKR